MMRPFTVAVDARVAVDEPARGIGKTILALYSALAAARPEWRFEWFCRTSPPPDLFAGCQNVYVRAIEMPGDRFGLWERVRLPAAFVACRPDVIHAPAGPAVWCPVAPLVTTIYDLIPIDTGRTDAAAKAWGNAIRHAARRAAVVLTSSEHARRRIVSVCGIPPSKIELVAWGSITAPANLPTPERVAELRAKYGVPPGGRYVLHFGMADPRKNTRHLIQEWGQVADAVRANVTLVIVGVTGASLATFRGAAPAGVEVHGYVPEDDARDLLGAAAALAYPTTYEGFGLPVLDGFAAGVPVVASNLTSVPEVAGDAAELVDPITPGAVARGLERVLADSDYAAELVRRGRERVRQFTWPAAAERVAAAFERAAHRRA